LQFRLHLHMDRPHNDITPQDLARLAIETFIRDGAVLDPPRGPKGVLAIRAGAFVTLRHSDGDLRGCIGTIEPVRSNVAEEIIQNAISAATTDPRFPPVSVNELPDLSYGVDVLSAAEAVHGLADLDPSVYGVIIETPDRSRRGLLLPRIEGIDSAEAQWLAVHSKAGIRPGAPIRVKRFTVTRFGKD
jgi:AmmeMemoRadiSam system protein A